MNDLLTLKRVIETLSAYGTDTEIGVNAEMGGLEFWLPKGTTISEEDLAELRKCRCRYHADDHSQIYLVM